MAFGFNSTNVAGKMVLDSGSSYFKLFEEGVVTSSNSSITGRSDGGHPVVIPNPQNLNPAKCLVFIQPKTNWISCQISHEATGPISPFHYLAKGAGITFNYRIFYVDEGGFDLKEDDSNWGMELFTEDGFKQFSTNHYLMDIEGFVTQKAYIENNDWVREWKHNQMYNAYYCIHIGMYGERIYAPGYGAPGKISPMAMRQTSAYGIDVSLRAFVGKEIDFIFEYDAYDNDRYFYVPTGHDSGESGDYPSYFYSQVMMYMSPHL